MTTDQSRPKAAQVAFRSAGFSLDVLDALAEHVDGAFVVLVRVTPSLRPAALREAEPPGYRRRVFLSAAAAERAARAAQGRGESCRVYLAELRPLHRLVGGDVL